MSYIFINALGILLLSSRILAACGSVDYLVFSCLAYFVIERCGRRKVMMCSALACSVCWIAISIATGLSGKGGNSYVLGSVAVAFFFVSIVLVSTPCSNTNQYVVGFLRFVWYGCPWSALVISYW